MWFDMFYTMGALVIYIVYFIFYYFVNVKQSIVFPGLFYFIIPRNRSFTENPGWTTASVIFLE